MRLKQVGREATAEQLSMTAPRGSHAQGQRGPRRVPGRERGGQGSDAALDAIGRRRGMPADHRIRLDDRDAAVACDGAGYVAAELPPGSMPGLRSGSE